MQFITSNKHKFQELRDFFSHTPISIVHIDLKYTEYQSDSFEKIVGSSATSLSTAIDGDFFIEDSGISIESLNNFPGPFSSFVYQTIGWEGILDLLRKKINLSERRATFTSIIGLIKNERLEIFKGQCSGFIAFEGRGDGGFGFDPIFIPEGDFENPEILEQPTFAQLPLDIKNQISHRSKSMAKLKEYLEN